MAMDLSKEEYQELIKHTTDIIMVVDESGTIKYESPSVQRITGYALKDRIGKNAFENVHPDDLQRVRETFSGVLESTENEIMGTEFRFQHKDGSWVWLESRGCTQTAPTVEGFVVSLRDVTQRKKYEQKLKQERDRLERFASFISHDLRNPLTVAEGRLEMAQEEYESKHLDNVEQSLGRIRELIEDILTLVREGDTEPQLETVDIRDTAEKCWRNIDTKAATLNIETDQSILAEESRLQRLLENLIRNGVEHGGSDVTITVGSLDDGFYVEDDGRGIPDDERESLLEYGFSTKSNGTGLGLSIVNEVVKSHGWKLVVTEGTGGGARFEIRGGTVVD